jgi:hypothetical protein
VVCDRPQPLAETGGGEEDGDGVCFHLMMLFSAVNTVQG